MLITNKSDCVSTDIHGNASPVLRIYAEGFSFETVRKAKGATPCSKIVYNRNEHVRDRIRFV